MAGADGVERLRGWFADGTLIRPDTSVPDTVALARAVMSLIGVPDVSVDDNARMLVDAIGHHEHYVFVMCDGLGMNLIERLPPDAFLRRSLAVEMRSVFPSSTAPALTTIATAAYPARHAVPTWWTYLPDAGLTTTILKYVERYSERPLAEFGVARNDVYPMPSALAGATHDVMAFTPSYIADSVTTSYLYADGPVAAYEHLRDASAAIVARVDTAGRPTYSNLYIPYVDAAEHEHGVFSTPVRKSVEQVDHALEKLAVALSGRARLIITADHGLVDVPPHGKRAIKAGDALLDHLVCPPSGEPRIPIFHVKPGRTDAFVKMFEREYGDDWALVATDAAHELGLFGLEPFDAIARPRFGDFVAIADGARELAYGMKPEGLHGSHGGMTEAEMRIPLALA